MKQCIIHFPRQMTVSPTTTYLIVPSSLWSSPSSKAAYSWMDRSPTPDQSLGFAKLQLQRNILCLDDAHSNLRTMIPSKPSLVDPKDWSSSCGEFFYSNENLLLDWTCLCLCMILYTKLKREPRHLHEAFPQAILIIHCSVHICKDWQLHSWLILNQPHADCFTNRATL